MLLFKPLPRQVLLLVFSVSFLGLWSCGDDEGDCHSCPPEILHITFIDTILYEGSSIPAIVSLVGENRFFSQSEVQILETTGEVSFFQQQCEISCSYALYNSDYIAFYGKEPRTFYVHFRDDVDTLVIDLTKKEKATRATFNGKSAYDPYDQDAGYSFIKDVY